MKRKTTPRQRQAARDRVNRGLDALIAETRPKPYACRRCFTVYDADAAECPYCATPTGEPADDEGDD